MATEVASPNGVFKRLDLEEKDMVSPTEINTANPTTPNVPSGMIALVEVDFYNHVHSLAV
jgi:hypothetical protein